MIQLFSDLINTKKVGKISLRTIPIPDLSKEALQVAPRLTRRQFSKLLERYIAIDLNKAMKAASLIHQAGTFKFKKVKLDELVRKKLENFWKLFAYAAN